MMDIPVQIGAALLLVIGAACLAHFFYVLMRTPESLNLGWGSHHAHTWSARAYLVVIVIGISAFSFSGAFGLVRWLSNELAFTLASAVALLSLGFLAFLERQAKDFACAKESHKVLRELQGLLGQSEAFIASQSERYDKLAASSAADSQRDAYSKLADLAARLAERDHRIATNVANAIANANHQAEEVIEQTRREVQKEVRRTEEMASQQRRLGELERAWGDDPVYLLSVVKMIEELTGHHESLWDTESLRHYWVPLRAFSDSLLKEGVGASLGALICQLPGVRVRDAAAFEVKLDGNKRDGRYDVMSVLGGEPRPLADGLIFEMSLEGILAAFHLQVVLPYRLAWGHGLYGHDQVLVTTLDQAVGILEQDGVEPENQELRAMPIPPGFRICRLDCGLSIRCLTYWPGKGFFDTAVNLSEGNASEPQESRLLKIERRFFY